RSPWPPESRTPRTPRGRCWSPWSAVLAVALARGHGGEPCPCFGSSGVIGPRALVRNALLTSGFAALPSLPSAALALAVATAAARGRRAGDDPARVPGRRGPARRGARRGRRRRRSSRRGSGGVPLLRPHLHDGLLSAPDRAAAHRRARLSAPCERRQAGRRPR